MQQFIAARTPWWLRSRQPAKQKAKTMTTGPTKEQEAKLLKFFLGNFNPYYHNRGSACDVAWITSGGAVQTFRDNGCHGILHSRPVDSPAVYTSLWMQRAEAYDACVAYFDFILDPVKSPYRAVLKGAHILRDAKGKYVALGLWDMGASVQLMANLFIQSRVPHSNWGACVSFAAFRAGGMEDYDAFYAAHVLQTGSDGKLRPPVTYGGAMDLHVDVDVDRMRRGDPNINKRTMNQTADYRPVNAIWHAKGKTADNYYKIAELVKDTPDKYGGHLPKLFRAIQGKDTFPGNGVASTATVIENLKKDRSWIS